MGLTEAQEAELADLLRKLQLEPRDAVAYARVGRLLDTTGDPRRAVSFLRTAVALSPRDSQRHDELCQALRRAAASVDAHSHRVKPLSASKQPAQRMPGDEDPCWRRERAECFPLEHYTASQLHIAESDFLRRVEADPTDTHGLELLATLYRNRSTAACVSALRLQPSRPSAYLSLARLMPRGGSVGLYRRALKLLPTHADLYGELGGVLADLRYYRKANDAYRLAIELAPAATGAYESLAELRLSRSRAGEAHDIARRGLALLPHAPAHLLAGSQGTASGRSQPPILTQEAAEAAEAEAEAEAEAAEAAAEEEEEEEESAAGGTAPSAPVVRASTLTAAEKAGTSSAGDSTRTRVSTSRAARASYARAAQSPSAMAISTFVAIMAEAKLAQHQLAEATALARAAIAIEPQVT